MSRLTGQGFTLVEMVISLAILSLSITALYAAYESSLSRTRQDARKSEAFLIAQSLLDRAGTEWPVALGAHDGDEDGFHYQLRIDADNDGAGSPMPSARVSARVSWKVGKERTSIELVTLKLIGAPVTS